MSVSRRLAGERGDDPLHAHEARALDEHRPRRRRVAERGDQRLDVAKARAPANGAAVFALSAPAAQSDSMPRSCA